jgi:TRAP-type uncharacterized transport system substrate-binding protein
MSEVSLAMGAPDGPTIARSIRLIFSGDWGMANLHRICGWLSQTMGERAGPESRFLTTTAHAGFDTAAALARNDVDVALATPACFARMPAEGRGPFAGRAVTCLRALAVLPQWDRLVLAVDAKYGIASFADLRRNRPSLKIAVSADNGMNHIGYATARIMAAAGIAPAELESWGGAYVERWRPDQCVALARAGVCDAVFQEAIMTPWWRELLEARSMVLLPIEAAVLDMLEECFGWARGELPQGYFPSLSAPLVTLDYSDFIVLVRDDLPEDVAYLLTWCLVETRAELERQYLHLPRERSPVTYPLEPRRMAESPIPLHPAAERYYRDAGHI